MMKEVQRNSQLSPKEREQLQSIQEGLQVYFIDLFDYNDIFVIDWLGGEGRCETHMFMSYIHLYPYDIMIINIIYHYS